MRKPFLTLMVLSLVSLCVQCSSAWKRDYAQTNSINRPANDVALANTGLTSDDLEVRKVSEHLMFEALKRGSLTLGIENLRDAAANDGTEMRVWVGFGLAYPRCFILKTVDRKHNAFYVTPEKKDGRAQREGNEAELIVKTALNDPLSGWAEFDRFLKGQGIEIPLTLSLDETYTSGEDEEFLVVEVKSGRLYNIAFSPLNTKSEDSLKALKVCRRIEQEFLIRMGCEK